MRCHYVLYWLSVDEKVTGSITLQTVYSRGRHTDGLCRPQVLAEHLLSRHQVHRAELYCWQHKECLCIGHIALGTVLFRGLYPEFMGLMGADPSTKLLHHITVFGA